MRFFVTGSAGFLGRRVASRLSKDGETVGTVRRQTELPWRTLTHDWTRPYEGRIDADTFVHAAFQAPSPSGKSQAEALCLAANEAMAANAAAAARAAGASTVVLLSTGSVYAERDGAVDETTSASGPSAYARSCARVEETFRAALPGVALPIIRLFHPYGPGQSDERLIPRLAARIRSGAPVLLRPGGGRPTLSPIFVSDAVETIARLASATALPKEPLAINLGGCEPVTIRELAGAIAEALGRTCAFEEDASGAPAADLYCRSELAAKLSGWAPATRLSAGLVETLRAFQEARS